MHNKHLTRLFFILTFLFLSSGAYVLLPDSKIIEKPKPIIQELPWKNTVTNTTINEQTKKVVTEATQKQINIIDTKLKSTTTTNSQPNSPIETNIEINGSSYKIDLPETSTAYDAMQKLIDNKIITASIKEFSGMGKFVEEINGIKNDTETGKYWIYYINDNSAKVGISAYKLKQNDKITWKYERSKF